MAWDYLPEKDQERIREGSLTAVTQTESKKSKYGNHKCFYNGIQFDSEREMAHYRELELLQKVGEISDLRLQVKYVLIPSQREVIQDMNENLIAGKVIERECSYMADFVYKDKQGNTVVEDTKGFRTEVYKIKKKLMLYIYHIEIKET